jgi:hypothetical protein
MMGLLERQYILVKADKAISAPQRLMVRQLDTLAQSQPSHTHSIGKVF